MKRKASKKYPVFTYAFYLILVGILVTGVTFSRYSITQSGDVSTGVAAFDCSYTIEDFSSLNFNNSDYWLTAGNDGSGGMIAAGTAHTVRVTMKNNNGKTSDTDVQAHLRVYMSSQLADNLAIQISTENTAGTQNTYTPQIPLGELFYGTTGGTNDNGTPVLYDKYKDYGNDDTVDTAKVDTADFHNYGDRSEAEDETLTVSGTLKDNGTLVVSGQRVQDGGSGLQMTVTAQQRTVNYAVGFSRGVSSTPVYLDLQREETYYTFDITLPSMRYEGGTENGSTHVVYFTLTDEIDNTAYWYNTEPKQDAKGRWYITTDTQTTQNVVPVYYDNNDENDENDVLVKNMNTLITDPSTGYYFRYGTEKVKITGYHFEQEATATYTDEEGTRTTVRVKCEYAEGGGTYNVSLYHVAPLSERAAHYVHPIKWGDDVVLMEGVKYSQDGTPFENIGEGEDKGTGTCINSEGGKVINISKITIDPIDEDAPITVAVNRSYYFDITALFVQASETP